MTTSKLQSASPNHSHLSSLSSLSPKDMLKLETAFKKMREKSFSDPVFFFNNFLRIYNPKKDPTDIPFKTYPYQNRLIRDVVRAIEYGEDIFVDKTREMGVSYIVLGVFLWYWLSRPGFTALVGSRTEKQVDNRKGGVIGSDDASLFAKLGYMIERLPQFMLPVGWNPRLNFPYLKLINPENGSAISGESSTANFSRSGRYQCVVADTYINTPIGLKTIAECMDEDVYRVHGSDNNLYKIATFIKRPPEPLVKVTTKFGYTITGTKDHPVLSNNGIVTLGELLKSKADERTSLKIISQPLFPDKKVVSPEIAEILGLLVSEGSVCSSSHIGFANKDEWLIDRYIELWKKVWGKDISIFKRKIVRTYPDGKEGWCFELGFSDIKIRKELLGYGLKRSRAKEKEVPEAILRSDKEVQIAFLKGLYEGDGSISMPKSLKNSLRVSYNSISIKLVTQLQQMLLSFGILSSLSESKRKDKSYYKNTQWVLRSSGFYAKKFRDEIGFLSERKNSVGANYESKTIIPHNKHYKVADGGWMLPIINIEEAEAQATYDIQMEDHHLFTTNGIVSHNCILLDEFAFFEEAYGAWGATRDASRCRIVVTTPGIKPGKAKRLRFGLDGEKIKVIEVPYHLHPEKNAKWLEKERQERSEEDFNREIMMDWGLSVKGRIYPELDSADYGKFPYIANQPLYVCGDYGLDGTVFEWWQQNPLNGKWRMIDSFMHTDEPIEFYFPLFGKPIDSMFIYTTEQLRAFEQISKLPKAIHFGDPSVHKRSGNAEKKSDFDKLAEIGIYVGTYTKDNSIEYRVKETKMFLKPGIEVNENERNYTTLDLMKQHRWKTWDEDHESTSTFRKAVHGLGSHSATAMEYLAVNLKNFISDTPEQPKNISESRFLTSRRIISSTIRRKK